MPKIITDGEMIDIINRAYKERHLIDDFDQYTDFVNDIADVICKHFGGTHGIVDGLPNEKGEYEGEYAVGFHIDENVPEDGGIYKDYDKDVAWKDGEEH